MQYRFITTNPVGTERELILDGRKAWALAELISAGPAGCTPIDNPAPRWSAYVHKLRHEYGLTIDTVHEPHGGDFPGTHARYVLRTPVRLASEPDERAAA